MTENIRVPSLNCDLKLNLMSNPLTQLFSIKCQMYMHRTVKCERFISPFILIKYPVRGLVMKVYDTEAGQIKVRKCIVVDNMHNIRSVSVSCTCV